MALTFLKNKVTGELKKIEAGCEEYLELAAKRIEDSAKPLWEDRGVAGHAETDTEPAKGNINERNYDDSLVGAKPELGINPDLVLATGEDRDLHAKVANSGTTAEGSQDPNGADRPKAGPPSPQAPTQPATPGI